MPPLVLSWQEIAIRLALAAGAGGVIGLNRSEHGHAAGLRTTLLVCLAAALAMVQTNILLNTTGKPSDSFVVADMMRLPLGILSGIGFIGAGAIVRRGEITAGVTTAAMLWFVTVMGLCFGGGQLGLGLAAFVLGIIILWVLKWAEKRYVRPDRRATLTVTICAGGPAEAALLSRMAEEGFRVDS